MQVKDKRDTSPPADVRGPVRALNPNYQVSAGNDADLFAEIFQGIAALTAPQPAQKTERSDLPREEASNEAVPSQEKTTAEDEPSTSEDEVVIVAGPTLPLPIQATTDESVAETDLADSAVIECCAKENASSGPSPTGNQDASVEPGAAGNQDRATSEATSVLDTQPQSSEEPQTLEFQDDSVGNRSDRNSEGNGDAIVQNDALESQLPDALSLQKTEPEPGNATTNTVSESDASTVNTNASNSDSGPRDRRDRRTRGNDSDRRVNDASVDAAKGRSVDANNASAATSVASTSTSAPSPSLASATASITEVPASPTTTAAPLPPTSVPVAAMAAAVNQAMSAPAASATIRGEGSTGSSPIVGGVTTTSSEVAEAVNTKSTPASRQAEVADRARLVHRIAKAFQKMGVDGGQVRLRMHPDDLGSVQLDMKVSGRSVSATVIAENEEAVQLLQGSLSELRQRLESQGLLVERLEVERRSEDEAAGSFSQNSSQNHNQYGDQAGQNDGLWGRSSATRSNSLGSNLRISGQNPDLSASVTDPRRAVLSGDRALDLRA